jgi:hypothetical protein
MQGHRSTPSRVSRDPQHRNFDRNFDLAAALKNLRTDVVEIEALARATEAAAELLPAPTAEHHEVIFGRIQALAARTSEYASASLRFANAQVAALEAHQEALRKAAR